MQAIAKDVVIEHRFAPGSAGSYATTAARPDGPALRDSLIDDNGIAPPVCDLGTSQQSRIGHRRLRSNRFTVT
tara:strand:- start:1485 stop:1703 length:219 start_codon:yes stop_codon:yes gene_type:complete